MTFSGLFYSEVGTLDSSLVIVDTTPSEKGTKCHFNRPGQTRTLLAKGKLKVSRLSIF